MQAVMLERALYKIPYEHGWFENHTKHAELGSSDEEGEGEEGQKGEDLFALEKDDHYQRVND